MGIFKRIRSKLTMKQGDVYFLGTEGNIYKFVDCYGVEWLSYNNSFFGYRILKEEFDTDVARILPSTDDTEVGDWIKEIEEEEINLDLVPGFENMMERNGLTKEELEEELEEELDWSNI